MLGRKNFTQEELDAAKSAVATQLVTWDVVTGVDGVFETTYFNGMALALDRRFVHRVRGVTGKETTPLNELELLVDALLNHGGVLRGVSPIRYVPESSVLGLRLGDVVSLRRSTFEALSSAVLAELEARFS